MKDCLSGYTLEFNPSRLDPLRVQCPKCQSINTSKWTYEDTTVYECDECHTLFDEDNIWVVHNEDERAG